MNFGKHVIEGAKMVALCAAIALVVWSMPERDGVRAHEGTTTGAGSDSDTGWRED